MKPTFKENRPRFQTLDDKRGEKSYKDSERKGKGQWESRGNRGESRGENVRRSEQRFSDRGRSPQKAERSAPNYAIYPQEGKKVGRDGAVQIWVKGEQSQPKEKKTGPLSPRAPEKIRNNRATEMKVYGENACIALFEQRPEAIVRLWITVEVSHRSGALMSYLAEQKKAYHVVDSAEMERVTGTEHHGGICLLVKKATPFSLEGYLQVPRKQDCLVLLDGVNNAQNIGGVVRTCAFYGVKGIVVENVEQLNSSASARVAEGGLEFVRPLETKHKQIALSQLRNAGYQIVHLTANKQATSLVKTALQSKVVFVLSEAVQSEVEYPEDTAVQLSFANPLKSGLNVAVNCGVLLSHWYQTQML